MSFKFKIITLILLVSVVPYLLMMIYFGNFLREKYYESTKQEIEKQLLLNVERINLFLEIVQKDMQFLSRLDVMNDIYSNDIDRRISNLLQEKKKELNLKGDFYLINLDGEVVASSNPSKIFTTLQIKPFFSVDVYSSFQKKKAGQLILDFPIENFQHFFQDSKSEHYYLILNNTKTVLKKQNFTSYIKVQQPLKVKKNIMVVLEKNQESFLNSIRQYEIYFIILLIIGAFVIGFVSYYLIDKLIKPVIALSEHVEKITASKDYSDHVKVDAEDEIGKLANAFNEMLTGIYNALRENEALTKEIEETQREVVFTMGAIGESRSKETGNHVKRVAEYSKLLALLYGLDEQEAELLKQASPMHDIGKIAIPDAVLNKPGRFDEHERKIMDTHAALGYEMLKHSQRPLLKAAAIVAYEHHEKWDGSGYPRALKGENIHIYGRITALADVFDALGSDRVYKKAWDDERIFKLFEEEKAKHFDPKLVELFFAHLEDFLKIRDRFKDTHE